MDDKQFLMWIHDRLVNVHGENELFDYMHRLRSIIDQHAARSIRLFR